MQDGRTLVPATGLRSPTTGPLSVLEFSCQGKPGALASTHAFDAID